MQIVDEYENIDTIVVQHNSEDNFHVHSHKT
jgi:hypothetical protein